MNGPGYIMSQADVQKLLINRGGNREAGIDFWEGFKGGKQIPEDMMNGLPRNAPQSVVSSYLKDRGGNRGATKEKFENAQTQTQPQPKFVDDEFYKGDKILSGNYFDGWNDTYFFNTSIFRENLEFWQNPYTFLGKN